MLGIMIFFGSFNLRLLGISCCWGRGRFSYGLLRLEVGKGFGREIGIGSLLTMVAGCIGRFCLRFSCRFVWSRCKNWNFTACFSYVTVKLATRTTARKSRTPNPYLSAHQGKPAKTLPATWSTSLPWPQRPQTTHPPPKPQPLPTAHPS